LSKGGSLENLWFHPSGDNGFLYIHSSVAAEGDILDIRGL